MNLPVAPLPRVDFPTIQVSASLPGASPETMASSVATPLERRFGRIAGLTEMTSTSTLGSTSITLQFDLEPQRGRRRAGRAGGHRRGGRRAAAGPAAQTDVPQGQPGRLARSSSSRSRARRCRSPQVFDAANTILAQKISQVHGVGQVYGGGRPAAGRPRSGATRLSLAGMGVATRRTCAQHRRRDDRRRGQGHDRRADPVDDDRRERPALRRRGLPATRRRAERPGGRPARATWRTSSTTSRTTASPAGPTASARCSSSSASSRTRTSSRPTSAS